MPRNFDRRVEAVAPVESAGAARRGFARCSARYLEDNRQAWELDAGRHVDAARAGRGDVRATHERLLARFVGRGGGERGAHRAMRVQSAADRRLTRRIDGNSVRTMPMTEAGFRLEES